jgi:cell division protein FtsB
MISAFASGTQADLEKEVMELKTENAMLQAQVEALSDEIAAK